MGNTQLTRQVLSWSEIRAIRGQLPDTVEATYLSRQGQALSDPERLRLLALLKDAGEICVTDACLVTDKEQGGVSRHLRILWDAGLADKGKRGKNTFYWPTSTGERLLTALLDTG